MYRTVVVGTDGSETAQRAVAHAADLVKLTGAELHIVTAYKSPLATGVAALGTDGFTFTGAEEMERAGEELREYIEAMLKEIASDLSRDGVEVKTYAMTSDAGDAIIEVAGQQDADLIVVGNRGMSGLARLVLGSVSSKVAHHAPCSVLIVHTTS